MSDELDDQATHGRLGRLFAALVGNEDDLAAAGGGSGVADDDAPRGADNTSVLDVEALSRVLMKSTDPMGVLRGVVADIRRRANGAGTPAPALPPSPFELYLATRLTEAGIAERDGALPALSVVRPRASDLFYLRVIDDSMPWPAKVRLLRTEAALNFALLVARALPNPNEASLEELVRCEQRICRSIVSQAPSEARRHDGSALGEWAVRSAISMGIERLQLPYRLTARFRTNVACGRAAIEIDLVPPEAWAATAYVDGLGVVSATAEMRRRAASDYNLRLGVLLAAYALLVAPQLSEVWVAGVVDTARGHACYYSARITRSLLEGLDLEGAVDPYAIMRVAGAALDAENRELMPVRQGFSLDDEPFCPKLRYEPVETSERVLLPAAAAGLGCARVRDLGSDEARARRLASTELVRELGDSTEKNVRALLSLADATPHDDVREAALRCVRKLVSGELDDDPLAIAESLVDGDELTRKTLAARELLYGRNMEGAEKCALEALGPVERAGAYRDGDGLVWRAFGSHTDRALYNLLLAPAHERCELVSESYLEAHLIASAAALAQGRTKDALPHARRACELAPLSSQASLHLAQCLEAAGQDEGAFDELCRLLSLAHDPESIGLGYLRMSQLQWRDGHVLAAQACYQRACRTLPGAAIVAGLAVVALISQVGSATDGTLPQDAEEDALRGAGIPLAPTAEVGEALLGAARSAVDAGVFWAARDLVRSLCSLFRDDVTFGVLRSIEDEPDR